MLIHSVALVPPNVVSNTSLFKRTARSLCAPMMMSVPYRQHPNHCLWKHVSYIQGQFPNPGGLQWYARVNLYQIMRTNHMHLFPTPCTMTSGWQLKTGHGGNIHIMEIGKYYESDFFLVVKIWLLNIYPHTTGYTWYLGLAWANRQNFQIILCSQCLHPYLDNPLIALT